MRRAKKVLALAAISAASACVGYDHRTSAATITWLGASAIADPNSATYGVGTQSGSSGIFTAGEPLYLWNSSTLSFSSGGNPVAFTVGDDVVFTDNAAARTLLRLTTSSMNPSSITFKHIAGSSASEYFFLTSGDFTNPDTTNVSTNTAFGANHSSVLTLDTGFLGTVHIRSRAGAGLAGGLSNTIIRGGTLEVNDNLPLPNTSNTSLPAVTLDGGTLAINSNVGGNITPASGNLAGTLTVLSNSTLYLSRVTPSETGGTVADSRTWQGTISMASGITLNLARKDGAVNFRLPANLGAAAGTFKLLDGGTFNNDVILENGAGAVNATFDLGSGTNILETNQTAFQIGKVIGSATTNLRGGFAFGGGNLTDTIVPVIADRTGGAASISKVGNSTITFSSANTYTGTTTVGSGTLALSGANGSAAGSGSIVLNGGWLKLDNSAANNNNRIGGNVALSGGNLEFVGDLTAGTAESAGTLVVTSSASTVRTTAVGSGGPAVLTFSGLSRTGGVVNFDLAPGANVNLAAVPTLANGIIGAYATAGGDNWATVTGNTVGAYTYIAGETDSAPGTWDATKNINLIAGGASAVSASTTINSLRVTNNSNVSIAAGTGLTIATGGILSAGTTGGTIAGPGSLTVGSGTGSADLIASVANAANTLTINAPIVDNGTGTVNLVKVGPGKLVLGGTNTFTGTVSVFGGTLTAGAPNVVPSNSTLVVNFGNTFDLGGFNQTFGTVSLVNGSIINSGGAASLSSGIYDLRQGTVSASMGGAGSLSKTTGSTVTLSAVNTYTGGTSVTGGTIVATVNGAIPAGGTVLLNAGSLNIGSTNQNIATLTLQNGTISGTTGVLTSTFYDLQNGTISAILAGSGVGITKSTTSTVVLSGANTYNGVVNINAGVLSVTSMPNGGVASPLGTSSNAAANVVLGNSALTYTGAGDSTDRLFSVSGGTAAINNNGAAGSLNFTNTGAIVSNGSTLTFGGSNTADNTFSPQISGSTGVVKNNGGQWILANATNSYTGTTTASAGTLTVSSIGNGGSPSPIGASTNAGTNLILNGGALKYTGAAGTTDRLFTVGTAGGSIDASGSGAIQFTNAGTGVGSATAGNRALTLTGTNGGNNTLAAAFADPGSGTLLSVTKSGTGKWVVSGNNTYTGTTTVNSGTLVLAGNAKNTVLSAGATATTGGADVKGGRLVLDYNDTGVAPDVKTILAAGFAQSGTKFSSGKIRTSNPSASDKGLGWKDDSTAKQETIAYTYYGDANLDGQVDVTDLGALATNWQTSNVWAGGDFDYSGFVDVTDLGSLATNWQKGVGNPLGPGSLQSAMAAVGLGNVTVPEPTTVGLLALCAAGVLARSRRRG